MKIVLISTDVWPSYSIFRKDFIEYLVAKNHVVYCFALDYTPESRKIIEGMGAIPVEYKINRSGMNLFGDIVDMVKLSRQLKKIKPDSVFSFFVKPSIYGTLASWLAKVPRRIAMLEGLGYIHTPAKSGMTIKKRILQKIHGALSTIGFSVANEVLFLNKDDPKDLSRQGWFNQKKFKVFGPIGLDLSKYSYNSVDFSKPFRFIFIARLLAEKGVFEYLQAARLVKKHFPNVDFVVLGGLDPENPAAITNEQLQEVIDEKLIIYPGKVSNVDQWIADSHVFVLPSYREGFPRSTQEGMAIGRAVITTDVPGCRETVVDGVNGFLVPPWDPEALAEKMIYLIEHPEELKRMGEESHRIAVEQYDVHKINPVLASIVTGETQ